LSPHAAAAGLLQQPGDIHRLLHSWLAHRSKCEQCHVYSRRRRLVVNAVTVTGALKGKGSPYSITEHRVPELIPVLGSQPAGDMSHKPGGRLPLLSTRPAVTPTTLKRAAASFVAWGTEAQWV